MEFKAETNKNTFTVQISKDVAPGIHLVRAYTVDGASAPRWFVVGTQKEQSEKEPNDNARQAQVIESLPVTLNGQLEKSGDVDSFAIKLTAGQWLVADVAVDGIQSANLTRAEMTTRENCWHYLEAMKRHMPGFANAYLISTGPQIGIRETRHPQARAQCTRAMALSGARDATSVALAGWPMENHHTPGKPTYESIGGSGTFQVPLDALRADGVDNLWLGGRLIGVDASAFGSVRVMGTAFATGHAAGVAAAFGADVPGVQAELRRQGAML